MPVRLGTQNLLYTFFLSGNGKDKLCGAGVGFAICTEIISKMETFPKGISDRLMTLHITLASNAHLTIISAYALMMMYAEK